MDSDRSNRQITTKQSDYKLIISRSYNRMTIKHILLPMREHEVELIIHDDR